MTDVSTPAEKNYVAQSISNQSRFLETPGGGGGGINVIQPHRQLKWVDLHFSRLFYRNHLSMNTDKKPSTTAGTSERCSRKYDINTHSKLLAHRSRMNVLENTTHQVLNIVQRALRKIQQFNITLINTKTMTFYQFCSQNMCPPLAMPA